MYKTILQKLTNGQNMTEEDVRNIINAINNDELTEGQISGFLVALVMKGTTLEETAAFAKAMRNVCVPLSPQVQTEMMDTCGTGGGLSTYNISTATAIVAAAAGIPIAKHGSRSISSLSGSADVLEALGVNINLTPEQAEHLIEKIGIAFIYAPLFHPVMCKVLPPEAALGIKTIFYTIIGPLINPAFAPRHLLGVYKPELLEQVAYVAKEIGYTRAMFVHGLDGLDEISLLGKTKIMELKDGQIAEYEIEPEDFGINRCTLEEIKTGTPKENAATIRGVFDGTITGAKKDAVVLNSAGALIVGGKANNFAEGVALARSIIETGVAKEKLDVLIQMSNGFEK
ncbi:MAG: anthranilate phosphoribosyltransferase [Clostridia bacterium]|mgnify:CR=1 FL=1|nr:anthranilate phosphoribosyltransferase [Clostridia bacterium]